MLTYEEINEHPYPFVAGSFVVMMLVMCFFPFGWVLFALSIILFILVCLREDRRKDKECHSS